jgi:toxin YoeB
MYLYNEPRLYWRLPWKRLPTQAQRINLLIKEIQRSLFEGIGKPEPLKFEFAGKWSRRITDEHRLVYQVEKDKLIIFQCRYHY